MGSPAGVLWRWNRLVFGQPRQEDMLADSGVVASPVGLEGSVRSVSTYGPSLHTGRYASRSAAEWRAGRS